MSVRQPARVRKQVDASVNELLKKDESCSSENEEKTIRHRRVRIRERNSKTRDADAQRKRKMRENETEVQRIQRLKKLAEATRIKRQNESDSQRKARLEREAKRIREKRRRQSKTPGDNDQKDLETEAERTERLKKRAEWSRKRRLLETDEERIIRQRKRRKEFKIANTFIENMLNEISSLHSEISGLKKQFKCTVYDVVQTAVKCNQDRDKQIDTADPIDGNKANNSQEIEKNHSLSNVSGSSSAKEFGCSLCAKNFATQLGLTIHQKEHRMDSEEFTCTVCSQVFNSYNSLSSHYIESHSFAAENESEEIIDEEVERSLHELEYCKTNKCPSCFQTFLHLGIFKRHVITEHRDNLELLKYFTFICSQCNEPHPTRKLLESHWKNICRHLWEEKSRKSDFSHEGVICKNCGIKLANDNELNVHMDKIHIEKTFCCNQCGNNYATERHLKSHLASVHSKTEDFCCEFCGNKYKSSSLLKSHKNHVHLKNKEDLSKCYLCSKRFANINALKNHIRIHTGEKPFKCSFCNKSYASLASKSVHEQSHKGYVCKMCENRFQSYAELCAHRKLHRTTDKLSTGDEPNVDLMRVCELCDKIFNTYSSWYAHQKNHDAEYTCDPCGKTFTTYAGLKEHNYLHENTKRFACSKCGQTFRQQGGFYQHRRLHHKREKNLRIVKIEDTPPIETIEPEKAPHSSETKDLHSTRMELSNSKANYHPPSFDDNENENTEWQDSPAEPEFGTELDLDDYLDLPGGNSGGNENIAASHEGYAIIQQETLMNDIGSVFVPPNNYVDFSKSNIPTEIADIPTASESSTQSGTDDKKQIMSVSITNCKSISVESSTVSTGKMKVEAECDDLHHITDDLYDLDHNGIDYQENCNPKNEQNDVNSFKTLHFPLDPFSSQLILKLPKLKEYTCDPCKKTFFGKTKYEIHQRTKAHRNAIQKADEGQLMENPEEESTDKWFECKYCLLNFPTQKLYKEHTARYRPNLSCAYCEEKFLSSSELFKHCSENHPGRKPLKCDICPKMFNNLHGLRRHKLSIHFLISRKDNLPAPNGSRRNPYANINRQKNCFCEICGKAHYFPWQVEMHMKVVHEGERFPCDICNKTFIRIIDLEVHKERHEGKRSFLCPHCGKTFTTNSDLSGHVRTVHLKLLSKSKLARKQQKRILEFNYHCAQCPAKFTTQKTLTNHLQLHDPSRKFVCDICGLRYKFPSNVTTHKSYVHSNNQ